jgi:hypothetical protein
MAFEAIEGCIDEAEDPQAAEQKRIRQVIANPLLSDGAGFKTRPGVQAARNQLDAARELLSALKEEKPAIGGRVGRAIKSCEES